jgi:uncharacterized membrane protein
LSLYSRPLPPHVLARLAFSGPVLWAISIHLDKYLVSRYFAQSSVAVLLVFTALLGLLLLPPIWLFRPAVTELPIGSMAVIAFSGLLYMTAIFFYLQALQSEEASVVAPFFQAAPLFGYVLAYFVLGERLSTMQMLGGGLIVAGGALLSIGLGTGRMFKARLVILMLACAFALALAGLIFKIYAVRDEFWTATFWAFVGQALFGGALLAITNYRRQLVALLRASPRADPGHRRCQRADQPRRHSRRTLCAPVCSAEPRPGNRQHHLAVRVRDRGGDVDILSGARPGGPVGREFGAKGGVGHLRRGRRHPGQLVI